MPDAESGKVLYQERVKWPPWMKVIMLGPSLAIFVVAMLLVASGDYGAFALLPVVALLLLVYYLFSSLSFTVTDRELSFGFPFYTMRFPVDRVTACEPYEIDFWRDGLGIHRSMKSGARVLSTRTGPGVMFTIEGETRRLAVSVDYDAAREALEKAGALRTPSP